MAEILLFHHAQGQTEGFLAFAGELRAAGHVVHTPDLYDGKTFTDLDDGVDYAKRVGFDTIGERGRLAADGLPNELVYAGFSLGAMPAQMLAQTRRDAKGALLFSAAGLRRERRDAAQAARAQLPRQHRVVAFAAYIHGGLSCSLRYQHRRRVRSGSGRDAA
jgi:dienelactone hydrolase